MRERGSGRSKPRACASCQHPLHPPPPSIAATPLSVPRSPAPSPFPALRGAHLPHLPRRPVAPPPSTPAPPPPPLSWRGRWCPRPAGLQPVPDRYVGTPTVYGLAGCGPPPPPHSSSLVRRWPPTCLAFPPSPPPCHRCCPSCPSDMCLPSPLLAMRHTPSPPVRCRRSPPRAVASLLPVPVRRATTAALSTNCPSTCGRHPRPHQGPTCRSCGRARPTIQSPPAGQGLGREAREEGGAPRPVVPPRLA